MIAPSKNGTPQPGGNGVHLNAPSSSSGRCPTGLTDYQDYQDSQGPSRLPGTGRDSKGVVSPTRETTCVVSLLTSPWDEFLVRAYEANSEHLDGIDEADPNDSWQLETPLFGFVHFVWSRPDLGEDAHRPAALFTRIEASLKQWTAGYKREHQEPPHGFTGDPWANWFGISREDAKTEFLDLWPRFRFPANQSPIDAAVMLARRMLLTPSDEVCQRRGIETAHDRPDGYCLFVSVCGHLQAALGDRPIYLPQDLLAAKLRVAGRTISRWRQWAVEDGYLRQVSAPGRRRAAEYRFDVSRWKVLEKKSTPAPAEGFGK